MGCGQAKESPVDVHVPDPGAPSQEGAGGGFASQTPSKETGAAKEAEAAKDGPFQAKEAEAAHEDGPFQPTPKQQAAMARAAAIQDRIAARASRVPPEERPKETGQGGSYWRQYGGDSLVDMLEHTTLVDARYLTALDNEGGIVPRCQDLPASACITKDTLWRIRPSAAMYMLPILVLS